MSNPRTVALVTRRYRYRIWPTQQQAALIRQTLGCCRVVWNDALAQWNKIYEETGKSPKTSELYTHCVKEAKRRSEREWLGSVEANALNCTIQVGLKNAFKNWFDSLKGKRQGPRVKAPRFRGRKRQKNSYETQLRVWRLEDGQVTLPKLGRVKITLHRPLPQPPAKGSMVTIQRDASGAFYVSFVVKDVPIAALPDSASEVGIDMGCRTLVTASDGTSYGNNRPLKSRLRKLRRLQRSMSRRRGRNSISPVTGKRLPVAGHKQVMRRPSTGWLRLQQQVGKLHTRVANIRRDRAHQISTDLVRRHGLIATEDLNVKGMAANKKVAKEISDAGMGNILTLVKQKAEPHPNREVVAIDRWAPSSKTCGSCGAVHQELRSEERWVCPSCGARHHRDKNAANNILRFAKASQASTPAAPRESLNAGGSVLSVAPAPAGGADGVVNPEGRERAGLPLTKPTTKGKTSRRQEQSPSEGERSSTAPTPHPARSSGDGESGQEIHGVGAREAAAGRPARESPREVGSHVASTPRLQP